MKSSISDKAEGTFHEVNGMIKDVTGKLTDNPRLEAEAIGEKIAERVQEKIGPVKEVWGNVVRERRILNRRVLVPPAAII
jgi:Uncharacterized protein conserved in bacteria